MLKQTMKSGRILVAALVLLAPAMSLAQVDTSDWACESCPFDQGYRAEIDAGATNVSDDAARFGNYTGYDEKGTTPTSTARDAMPTRAIGSTGTSKTSASIRVSVEIEHGQTRCLRLSDGLPGPALPALRYNAARSSIQRRATR